MSLWTIKKKELVPVLRRLVLSPCLHAVMTVAQGLPVTPIPKELLVTTMRNDMVNVRCLNVPSFLHALHAQRVCLDVLLPGFPPSCSVPSARSGPHLFRMQCCMFRAVFLSLWDQSGAPLLCTGMIGCSWHTSFLPLKKPHGPNCP